VRIERIKQEWLRTIFGIMEAGGNRESLGIDG
jgi:hypothetical protein